MLFSKSTLTKTLPVILFGILIVGVLVFATTIGAGLVTESLTLTTPLAVTSGGTGAATASAARTALGLVIGTNVQAWDADLDSWAGISPSTKAGSGANTDITSIGGSDNSATAWRLLQSSDNYILLDTTDSAEALTFGNATTNPAYTFLGSGLFNLNGLAEWDTGRAITAAAYQIGRDADGTNQLHFNVPTGASFEWSVNDTPEMTLSGTAINFQNNSITTTGGGSLTGTWSDLGSVTTVDINGGTIDNIIIGGSSAAAITGTRITANTNLVPDENDGAGLGISGTAWADLFLASGGVINWNAGNVTLTQAASSLTLSGSASTSGVPAMFTITPPNNTGITAEFYAPQFVVSASTQTWATGPLTAAIYSVLGRPTYAFAGASTVSFAINTQIDGVPALGTNATYTNATALAVSGGTSHADVTNSAFIEIAQLGGGLGAATTLAGLEVGILGGSSQILGNQTATLTNLNSIRLPAITYTSTTNTRTVTNPATLYIEGAPVASTNVTFSNGPYSLWVDAGNTRLDGSLLLGATTAPAVAGSYTQTQAVATSGSPKAFLLTGGAHTTLAASTEASDVVFDLNRTVQFSAGALTLQRAFVINRPTYSFDGASTLTTAISQHIAGIPNEGANATITYSVGLSIGGSASAASNLISAQTQITGISNSKGDVASVVGHYFGNLASVSLGNQTANLTSLYSGYIESTTYTSTTNTRTVTDNVASLYIQGAPVAGTNVVFSNTAYSLWVDAGDARFDGNVGIGVAPSLGMLHLDKGTGVGQATFDGSTGGCIMLRDTDDAGWTEVDALDGVLSASVDADGLCD